VTDPELTRDALDKLLVRLDPDRHRAGERYEAFRRRLVFLFGLWRCPVPEEQADDTFDRVARRVDEGEEIREPAAYFRRVAYNVLHEQQRRPESRSVSLEDLPPGLQPAQEPMAELDAALADQVSSARMAAMRSCLDRLPPQKRELLITYYSGSGRDRIRHRAVLAARLGISGETLRLQVFRTRGRLAGCFKAVLDQPVPSPKR
jgi:RNA polymerase sigma factor (sigma-70 family)